MAHGCRRVVAAGTLALCVAASPPAEAARFPNIIKKTFVFRGPSARAFARLLHLPAGQAGTVRLELSQFDEHSALPERDAALRDQRGTLPSNLSWRLSDRVQTTVTWKPRPALLEIDGYVRDLSTAAPRPEGPACLVYSPAFSETDLDQLPGWKPLFLALRALPAKPGQGVVLESRSLEETLDDGRRAIVSLVHSKAWDDRSQPVQKWQVSIHFGPVLGTTRNAKCE